ncbi:MAG: hypothetical protein IPF77_20725 [Gemmatimonadetes bacterium]|nr:hypothetical protein [Gemmatimonadota bacterium]
MKNAKAMIHATLFATVLEKEQQANGGWLIEMVWPASAVNCEKRPGPRDLETAGRN